MGIRPFTYQMSFGGCHHNEARCFLATYMLLLDMPVVSLTLSDDDYALLRSRAWKSRSRPEKFAASLFETALRAPVSSDEPHVGDKDDQDDDVIPCSGTMSEPSEELASAMQAAFAGTYNPPNHK